MKQNKNQSFEKKEKFVNTREDFRAQERNLLDDLFLDSVDLKKKVSFEKEEVFEKSLDFLKKKYSYGLNFGNSTDSFFFRQEKKKIVENSNLVTYTKKGNILNDRSFRLFSYDPLSKYMYSRTPKDFPNLFPSKREEFAKDLSYKKKFEEFVISRFNYYYFGKRKYYFSKDFLNVVKIRENIDIWYYNRNFTFFRFIKNFFFFLLDYFFEFFEYYKLYIFFIICFFLSIFFVYVFLFFFVEPFFFQKDYSNFLVYFSTSDSLKNSNSFLANFIVIIIDFFFRK